VSAANSFSVIIKHPVSSNQHRAHAPCFDGNGNITELINLANNSVSARYEYGPFGETISVDGGAVAEANPFRFSTKYLDAETGIVNYELRPYSFWNVWSTERRDRWFKDFKSQYGSKIEAAAKRHCIPKELLATTIANEMIDYTDGEQAGEDLGFGESVGPAQISVNTTARAGVRDQNGKDFTRDTLQKDDPNIEAAAQLMKIYLDKLCDDAQNGRLSDSFIGGLAYGCNIGAFCCTKQQCSKAVIFNAPRCLIQAMAAMWNNGPGLARLNNIHKKAPNGWKHGNWAGELDGYFDP
jgi:hypothetical protein